MRLALEGDGPLYLQVYRALCRAMEDGRLPPSARLPGSRTLAQSLGVSRTVVLQAFAQLDSEGITVGNRGSGTYVRASKATQVSLLAPIPAKRPRSPTLDDGLPQPSSSARRMLEALPRPAPTASPCGGEMLSFADARMFQDALGSRQWQRTLMETLHARADESQDILGEPALRRALAKVLRHERGIMVEPDDIVIVAGIQQARDLIARVLVTPGTVVGIEDPAYRGVRATFAGHGASVVPCEVGQSGLDVDAHAEALAEARLLYVMPSQQFPTSVMMDESLRHAVLAWAYRQGAYIIEDDFESEHRLVSRALPPLFALDAREQVIHVGAFAREFFPALRLAYVIAPRKLAPFIQAAKWVADQGTGTFMQQVLARYLACGHYVRNLRRLFVLLARQRESLLASLARHMGDRVSHQGTAVSGNLLLHLPGIPRSATSSFLAKAMELGLLLQSADVYYAKPLQHLSLLLRYAHIPASRMDDAVRRLAQAYEAISVASAEDARPIRRAGAKPLACEPALRAIAAASPA